MVQSGRQVRRAPASPHVKPVHSETRLEGRLRETAHVTGFARSFEAMRQKNLPQRLAVRPLRLHQYLNIGLGSIKLCLHRVAFGVKPARPEISSNGQKVIVR